MRPFKIIKKINNNAYTLNLPPKLRIHHPTVNIEDITLYKEPLHIDAPIETKLKAKANLEE